MKTKKGAGGLQQPYIPAGHGEESGEYTSFDSSCLQPRLKRLVQIIGYEEIVKFAYQNHKPPIVETEHIKLRLKERNISRILIAEAILTPLCKSETHFDKKGRPSITYFGPNVTIYVNPKTGQIITVHKTRRNIRNKYKEKKNDHK